MPGKTIQVSAKSGAAVGFGCVLAITMSWTANQAIGWALLHGVFGWFYVIYYLISHSDWTWF
ncbi:MAG: hypothetical protein ACYTGZ_04820 [Planctomycetota bacterium]|jgi:hypothetical protein